MNSHKPLFAGALGCLLVFGAILSAPAADDPLAWPAITAQTKPWALNWWMGSAVDKTNLTKELERYAAAGLGGVNIIPIYGAKGWEDKYITYLSPKWMEMMGWTVSEANRLGMGVDMTTGSGWCFGGPQITDQDANANVVVQKIPIKKGEPWVFNHKNMQAAVAVSPSGESHDFFGAFTNELIDWAWNPPSDGWMLYVISQKPSGQKVKRAGPGGEGWMLNLLYPPAMDDFLKPYTAAFAAYTGPKPRAQYHDSYEYKSDWSPSFFAEFEKRRGYKLQTELPALFGTNTNDHAARVKCDYRQTVSEIMAEESLPAWVKWSHDHGFITRDQAHGSPGNWLDLYADADIPETEMFHSDRDRLISKFASSAAHVTGKPLVSAETGTWLEEHFTEKLSDMKYLLDDMFLSGVNHVFYHGTCYSPDEAGWPGWDFYASTEMNPRNPIWRDVPALNTYAARCQSILQSGAPDDDILLYWPIADYWMQPGTDLLQTFTIHNRTWFEDQPIGKAAKELWNRGYAFDYVSDAQLKTAKVVDGKILMPGGKYQVIVVPECKYIPLETFKQLFALAENGATIIVQDKLPGDVPGFDDYANRHAEFQKLTGILNFSPWFGEPWARLTNHDSPSSVVYKTTIRKGGTIWHSGELDAMLAAAQVASEEVSNFNVRFVRRSFDGGWIYFFANRGTNIFDDLVSLGRDVKSVVILDPMTGQTGVAQIKTNFIFSPDAKSLIESLKDDSVKKAMMEQLPRTVPQKVFRLQLAAGESLILRAFSDKKAEGPAWNYWQTSGEPVAITGQWNVKFIEGGPTLPADYQTAKLASWTTFPDTNTSAFAGTAKYEATFDAQNPQSAIRTPQFFLDLGDVRQSARVKLNGKDYGTLITPPFRVVVDNLKPTGNTLEVEVTSVAANRIRDLDRRGVKWKTFNDINVVDINYKPFDASNWPLTDCGLLGPVTLTAVTKEPN